MHCHALLLTTLKHTLPICPLCSRYSSTSCLYLTVIVVIFGYLCMSVFVISCERVLCSAEYIGSYQELESNFLYMSTYLASKVDCDSVCSGGNWTICTIWSRIQRLWVGHQAVSLCQAETGLQVMQTAGSLRTAVSQMLSWWSWDHCWRREGGDRQHLKVSIQR